MKLVKTFLAAAIVFLVASAFSTQRDFLIKSDKTVTKNGVQYYLGNAVLDNSRDVHIEADQMMVKKGSKTIEILGLKKFGVKSVVGNADNTASPVATYDTEKKELIIN